MAKTPWRIRAKQLLDELIERLRRRDLLRRGSKERLPAAKPDAGTWLHLVSLGIVATAVVVTFFGLGFFLLAHPEDDAPVSKSSAEVRAFTPSVSAAQSSQTNDQTPPAATGGTTSYPLPDAAAHPATANASSGASSQEQPGLGPNEETTALAALPGPPPTKKTAIARHRHNGPRKHWVSVYRPEPYGRSQPVSGPEKAWRWIVRSATSVLAALSPPPPRQAASFRTR